MNWRTTLILALVVGALFSYLFFFDTKRPGSREAASISDKVLGKFDRRRVSALWIAQGDTKIDLRLDEAATEKLRQSEKNDPNVIDSGAAGLPKWMMVAPIADRADPVAIDLLLGELENLRRGSAVVSVPGAGTDKSKLAAYGLQNPRIALKIESKAKVSTGDKEKEAAAGAAQPAETELFFGNPTALEGRTYVQVAGRDEVLAVDDSLRKQLEKGAAEFRDHRLTEVPGDEVVKLTVKNAAGTMEFAKDRQNHWRLVKPQNARAGDNKMRQLVNRLVDMRIDSFVPEAKAADAAALGLAEPRGTLTFSTGDNPPRSVEVQLGKPVEAEKETVPTTTTTAGNSPTPVPSPLPGKITAPNTVYARVAGRPTPLTLPKAVEDFLNLKTEDVRDRQLLRLNADTVDRIRISGANVREGELVFNRAKEAAAGAASPAGGSGAQPEKRWNIRVGGAGQPEKPANGAEAERMLKALPAQTISAFVADTASDLAKYGLDQPAVRIVFSAVSSENTAESAAGETPLATLSFGKVEGNVVYARLEEEPFIVSVGSAVLDAVPTDPILWQPLAIFQADPEQVKTVTVGVKDRPELRLERGGEGTAATWKFAAGSGEGGAPDSAKAQSLVNTLARLRAVRWIGGAARPEYGLTPTPAATLTFVAGASATNGKLLLGARSPEGMWYGQVEGQPAIFLISEPDHATLLQSLGAATPPAPAAAPSPTGGR